MNYHNVLTKSPTRLLVCPEVIASQNDHPKVGRSLDPMAIDIMPWRYPINQADHATYSTRPQIFGDTLHFRFKPIVSIVRCITYLTVLEQYLKVGVIMQLICFRNATRRNSSRLINWSINTGIFAVPLLSESPVWSVWQNTRRATRFYP